MDDAQPDRESLDRSKLDLDGNGSYTGTNEHDDTRTHNLANEILTRDVNSDSTTDYTLTHDAAGNLTDDGKDYAYVYDAWYRLRQIKNRTSGNVVSEHKYYGNGFRAGEHYDSDASGTVDSSDKWFWFAYDERWRILGTYRDADSSPKERFLHHSAGLGGYGGSSYIDDVVLRERDANTDWNGTAADGTLEERLYYCQNWRHDVVALVTSGGAIKERAKYFAYGIPFGIPLGDCDGDGDVDAADQSILLGAWGTSTVRCDLNLDGTVNASDQSIQSGTSGSSAGFSILTSVGNRLGYAGYAGDLAVQSDWHVRIRAELAILGAWNARDPAAIDALYCYAHAKPIRDVDPTGLKSCSCMILDCEVNSTINGIKIAVNACRAAKGLPPIVAQCCDSNLDPGCAGGTCGYYDPVSDKLCMCNDIPNCEGWYKVGCGGEKCSVLSHELIHAWQTCSGNPPGVFPIYPPPRQGCFDVLCKEIGAFANQLLDSNLCTQKVKAANANDESTVTAACNCVCSAYSGACPGGAEECMAVCKVNLLTCKNYGPTYTPTPGPPNTLWGCK
ncbi:MAG: hypothetical protein U0572_01240 [Phycisphaerales bacterium]